MAHHRRWHTLEGNERAIWGTLGNPADPFRTQVDFKGPAFHCSCPVRRKPCKHAIGLLLLFARNNDAFQLVSDPPDWVADWLVKRDERKTGPKARERDPEAEQALAEKRRETRKKRLLRMEEGLAELEAWLTDLLRQGLASLEGQSGSYWSELAARMTDAKLGGVARRIRRLPMLMEQMDWHEKLLAELGELYLLVSGFRRFDRLPEPLQDDLLGLAGVNFKKEEVLSGDALEDHWLVAGQLETEEEGNLMARRTWFVGQESRKNALLLEFAWGGGGYDADWKPGTVVKGEVCFYPSAWPHRILFRNVEPVKKSFDLKNGFDTLEAFAKAYAGALGQLPWLSQFPAFLLHVIPVFQNGIFVLVDKQRHILPLDTAETRGWEMVALSGGHPLSIFGTWNGERFFPLSAIVGGAFRGLTSR